MIYIYIYISLNKPEKLNKYLSQNLSVCIYVDILDVFLFTFHREAELRNSITLYFLYTSVTRLCDSKMAVEYGGREAWGMRKVELVVVLRRGGGSVFAGVNAWLSGYGFGGGRGRGSEAASRGLASRIRI